MFIQMLIIRMRTGRFQHMFLYSITLWNDSPVSALIQISLHNPSVHSVWLARTVQLEGRETDEQIMYFFGSVQTSISSLKIFNPESDLSTLLKCRT